jgi:Mg-chelatase subunit ChlD
MDTALVKGSLYQVAQQSGRSLAEQFVNVRCAVIVDVSGSMEAKDAGESRSRWQAAGAEMRTLQAEMPGEIAVIAFSDRVQFVPSGVLPRVGELGGGTGMARALDFVREIGLDTEGVRVVLVSDGAPNSREATLATARKFTQRIDTIFVGPEGGRGAEFLAQLAAASGGVAATASLVKELAATTRLLLTE